MKLLLTLFASLFLLPQIDEIHETNLPQTELVNLQIKSTSVFVNEFNRFQNNMQQVSVNELRQNFDLERLTGLDKFVSCTIQSFTVAFENKATQMVAVQQFEYGVHQNEIKQLANQLSVGTNLFIENIVYTNQNGIPCKIQGIKVFLIP